MGKKTKKRHIPTAEDFTDKAVRKAVLKETLQHPLTVFPLAASLVSLFYMSLINPDPLAFLAGVGSGAVSIGAWIVNYFFRGEKYAEKYINEMRSRREYYKEHQLSRLLEDCKKQKFRRGEQAFIELNEAYETLCRFLNDHLQKGDMSAQRFLVLAEDAFQKGIGIIKESLNTFMALKAVNQEKLNHEVKNWRRELEELENRVLQTQTESVRYDTHAASLSRKIKSHQKRLELYRQMKVKLEELLAECEQLEGSLESAYLQVVEMVGRPPETMFKGRAATDLERAVSAAKRVEDRLRSKDAAYDDNDEEYLESGAEF